MTTTGSLRAEDKTDVTGELETASGNYVGLLELCILQNLLNMSGILIYKPYIIMIIVDFR